MTVHIASVGDGVLAPPDAAGRTRAERVVAHRDGSFRFPYLQTDDALSVGLRWLADGSGRLRLRLLGPGIDCSAEIDWRCDAHTFSGLEPGDYRLIAEADGTASAVDGIAVGELVACLGDSITEGYLGTAFPFTGELHPERFPPAVVSRDRRTFSQPARTAYRHHPGTGCFASWLPRLADLLAERWRRPLMCLNEGWGSATVATYMQRIRHDGEWRGRIARLRPTWWTLHLGVNDANAGIAPKLWHGQLLNLLDLLQHGVGARPERIVLARPCYNYGDEVRVAPLLAAYSRIVDAVVASRGLRPGPDFFTAFQGAGRRWYGADIVHPDAAGMEHMAGLWADAFPG